MNIHDSDILTLPEVAELLRVSKQTVYNMIKDKTLTPSKVGREYRFIRSDVMQSVFNTKEN